MRGSPLIRCLAALLILLALGLPLRQMLKADGVAVPAEQPVALAPSAATPAQKVHLQVSFTSVPARFAVSSLGVPVWTDTTPAPENEMDLTMAFPKEGVDLQFDVDWPENGPAAAARVRLRDPDGNESEKLIWGTGATSTVLTFP